MSEEVKTLNKMKGTVMVVVHVKDLKDHHPNTFVLKLPFRPCRGDWINLEGQELRWDDLEVPKIIPEVARDVGLLMCSAIKVEEVVIFCDVERDECIVHVYGTTGVDPLHNRS